MTFTVSGITASLRPSLLKQVRLFSHASLVSLLNTATEEIMTSGEFETIMLKYAKIAGVLLMQRPQYQ